MTFKNCNKDSPMPQNYDQNDRWIHHDVTELEDMDTIGVRYKCNCCGLEFIAENTRGDFDY